jgi:polar amino acid transport system substrate-binding protein
VSDKGHWLAVGIAGFCIGLLCAVDAGAQSPQDAGALPSAVPVIPYFQDRAGRPAKPDREIERIRFLTSANFPPFNFVDSKGRLVGFHVELARQICSAIGARCTIQAQPFSSLTQLVTSKRADAIVAGVAITGFNRLMLDFTRPYLALPGRFVVRTNSDFDPVLNAFAGKRIAVVEGSSHQAYLTAYFGQAKFDTHTNATTALEALRSGAVDAYFGDAMKLSFWLNGSSSQRCCRFAGGPYLDRMFFGPGLAIAVARENGDLRAVLDHGLALVIENGAFADLYQRFFPISFY